MTVFDKRAPYWMLIHGKWVHLAGIDPGVEVAISRPTTALTTLGNAVYVQRAARVNRTWSISLTGADPEASRWLDYAATISGDVYWLDGNAAQVNMLDPRDTKGKSWTEIYVNGVPMRAFEVDDSSTVPVRAGVRYHLSYTTTATAGDLVGWVIGRSPPDQVPFGVAAYAPPGTGARRGSCAFRSDVDADATITWRAGDVTSGARLTQGSVDDFGFMEGRSAICRVSVSDVSATWVRTYRDAAPVADQSYTIQEVG